MALNIYWDQDFNVKTLKPTFTDGGGSISPRTLSGATEEFQTPTNAVYFEFTQNGIGSLQISVSYDGVAYENGYLEINPAPYEVVRIPLQGVSKVKLTTGITGTTQFSFQFLLTK